MNKEQEFTQRQDDIIARLQEVDRLLGVVMDMTTKLNNDVVRYNQQDKNIKAGKRFDLDYRKWVTPNLHSFTLIPS